MRSRLGQPQTNVYVALPRNVTKRRKTTDIITRIDSRGRQSHVVQAFAPALTSVQPIKGDKEDSMLIFKDSATGFAKEKRRRRREKKKRKKVALQLAFAV